MDQLQPRNLLKELGPLKVTRGDFGVVLVGVSAYLVIPFSGTVRWFDYNYPEFTEGIPYRVSLYLKLWIWEKIVDLPVGDSRMVYPDDHFVNSPRAIRLWQDLDMLEQGSRDYLLTHSSQQAEDLWASLGN